MIIFKILATLSILYALTEVIENVSHFYQVYGIFLWLSTLTVAGMIAAIYLVWT